MTAVTRVAFVSDVHGNLPALEAVLEELAREQPFDRVVGGGDYVAGGVYPKESLDRMRRQSWDFVRGNADEWVVHIATNGEAPARNYPPGSEPSGALRESLAWGADKLAQEDIDFLAGLDIDWSLFGASGQKLVYVHSTPESTHPVYGPDTEESSIVPMFYETGADVLLHGHIHVAYLRDTSAGRIGCVGSVGLPFDRDPRPCFLIATDDGTGWVLEHRRVTYDNEAYAIAVQGSGIPHSDAAMRRIRTAQS